MGARNSYFEKATDGKLEIDVEYSKIIRLVLLKPRQILTSCILVKASGHFPPAEFEVVGL